MTGSVLHTLQIQTILPKHPAWWEHYPHFTSKGTEVTRVAAIQVPSARTVVPTWNPCPLAHLGLYVQSDVLKAILRLTFYLPRQLGWFSQCWDTCTPAVDSNSSDTPNLPKRHFLPPAPETLAHRERALGKNFWDFKSLDYQPWISADSVSYRGNKANGYIRHSSSEATFYQNFIPPFQQ